MRTYDGPRVFLALLLVFLGVDLAGASAAAQVEAPLEVKDVDLNSRPHVSLTVTAPRELIGRELTGEHFAVYENGEKRQTTVRRLASDALEVVLVIDTSGSMQGAPMDAAKAAATEFVNAMPAGTRIGVVGFGSEPAVAGSLGSPPDALVGSIGALSAQGETALYDALVGAGEEFVVSTTPGARRFVVLLSDGGDTASRASLDEAVGTFVSLNTGFYAVALATEESDLGALAQLAKATEGKVVAASDPSEIAGLYDSIASQLVSQYEVRYRSVIEGPTALEVVVQAEGVVARWQETVEFPPLPAAARAAAVPAPEPYTAGKPGLLAREWLMLAGAVPVILALAIASWLVMSTRPPRRRRLAKEMGAAVGAGAGEGETSTPWAGMTERATAFAERMLEQGGRSGRLNAALERAGLVMRPGEFVVAVGAVAVAVMAVSVVMYGPVVALAGVGAVVAVAVFGLSALQKRRRRLLAEQLGDTLQLLAGALRSGHGLLQALDMVTSEAESPTAEEFHRVIVESRLGRDLSEALEALAHRAGNEDVEWVVQAIKIHREVGGDLAEILDRVGETIRDRNRVRGQIRSLTAEGRLSAIILMALPFLVGGWMWITNRPYVSELFTRPQGRTILAVGAFLMTMGALVLKRLVKPEF